MVPLLCWLDECWTEGTKCNKRELPSLGSNGPILFMSMQLEFFTLIKEVFTSVDYTYKINFKRWTVFITLTQSICFYIWLTVALLINVRFECKLCFYASQTKCQQTNCWQFWHGVPSLFRERITMLPGTVQSDIR